MPRIRAAVENSLTSLPSPQPFSDALAQTTNDSLPQYPGCHIAEFAGLTFSSPFRCVPQKAGKTQASSQEAAQLRIERTHVYRSAGESLSFLAGIDPGSKRINNICVTKIRNGNIRKVTTYKVNSDLEERSKKYTTFKLNKIFQALKNCESAEDLERQQTQLKALLEAGALISESPIKIDCDSIKDLTSKTLKKMLLASGVDSRAWGTGGSKKFQDLVAEIRDGDAELVEKSGHWVIHMNVAMVEVRHVNPRGAILVLKENCQVVVQPDGTRFTIKRNANGRWPAEKQHRAEDDLEAAQRCVKEELRINSDLAPLKNSEVVTRRHAFQKSKNYPGLLEEVQFIHVAGTLANENLYAEYKEHSGKPGGTLKTTYFKWENENTGEESVPIVASGKRLFASTSFTYWPANVFKDSIRLLRTISSAVGQAKPFGRRTYFQSQSVAADEAGSPPLSA